MGTKNTVLFNEHVKLNALMAPFAGWNMPIHYGSIIEEAKHTRSACTVFDICHMGEFYVTDDPAKPSLDAAITNPVAKMKNLTCRYGFLLNANGTVIDDLIAYRMADDRWMIVVNASNIDRDAGAISSKLSKEAAFENVSERTAKLDVQGPQSLAVMKRLVGDSIKKLKYFTFDTFDFLGGKYIISRTGYTGELGFEVYTDAAKAPELWNWFLKQPGVKPAGLGARDILRLEAGLPLYGDELTGETTPLDAGMEKFLDFEKDFTGREALLKQKKSGVARTLTGLLAEGRRQPRHLNKIVKDGREAGFVTSGVFSPHLNKAIAFAYVDRGMAIDGTELTVVLEKGETKAVVTTPPFIKNTSIKYREE
ncbi:MAG: glycine cleavage system aminomethyltransferase GcvT [Spirochaetia bacterium]|nr:glycine cleavage system aminomethyltransferase GcvT [Spirochaetia bacterium]